jgi:large subunit ribosomal protein L4
MPDKNAAKVIEVSLPAEIFDVATNIPLIHQVVVAQQAAARQGTHSTKRRGEVSGGGRKPYKQKGTGRARQGSTRAPQFAGGGIVHGPKPRDYSERTPKKMKAAALKGALSDRARSGRIHVVEGLTSGARPSTRDAVKTLSGLSENRRQLIVLERDDAVTWLSLRNVPDVHLLAVDQLNTYDVLLSDDVIFTKGAYDAFIAGTPGDVAALDPKVEKTEKPAKAEKAEPKAEKAKAEPKAKAEKPAAKAEKVAEAPAAEVREFAGSAQPLENGEAPEGYEIKGNADSMKFHAPGGRWYDATVAEVWFKTAADAEAAGFVEAGSKKSIDAADSADREDDK